MKVVTLIPHVLKDLSLSMENGYALIAFSVG